MSWTQLRDSGTIFQVRVGGVAVSDGRVLLHRTPQENFSSVPGGRLQLGETAAEALQREMREEINADVEVGSLLWLVENFFEHRPLDHSGDETEVSHHEVGIYLEISVARHFCDVTSFMGTELTGTPHEFALQFRCFPQAEVPELDVRPAPLRDRLAIALPDGVPSIVERG